MDFAKVLAEIARFLEGEKARFALAGGLAMHAHGMRRITGDIDFAVEEAARDTLVRHMESLGYKTLRTSEGFSNHVHRDPKWGRVDFIYLDLATANVLFPRAIKTKLAGVELLAPSPEHVVAMKVQAIKSNPSRTYKDLADIQFLMRLPGIDELKVRGYFEKHGLASRFDEIKRIIGRDRDPGDAG